MFSTHLLIAKTEYSPTIECRGDQVLFIEFGAGKTFYTETELRLYQNVIPNFNPIPKGKKGDDDIGEYGSSRAKKMYCMVLQK